MGSVDGLDAGRTFTFMTFYMFASAELMKKKTVLVEQPVGEHSHLEMMPLQLQGAFQPKPLPAMPLPSSMFPIPWAASAFRPPQCPFYRACKKPSRYVEAGEKMPERNLGTDRKSD